MPPGPWKASVNERGEIEIEPCGESVSIHIRTADPNRRTLKTRSLEIQTDEYLDCKDVRFRGEDG